eukprot:scaffold459_cov249-Pinguiococcus_pyrenoidosus.AAC.18
MSIWRHWRLARARRPQIADSPYAAESAGAADVDALAVPARPPAASSAFPKAISGAACGSRRKSRAYASELVGSPYAGEHLGADATVSAARMLRRDSALEDPRSAKTAACSLWRGRSGRSFRRPPRQRGLKLQVDAHQADPRSAFPAYEVENNASVQRCSIAHKWRRQRRLPR